MCVRNNARLPSGEVIAASDSCVRKRYNISLQHEQHMNRPENKIEWNLAIVYESRQPTVDTGNRAEAESNEYC